MSATDELLANNARYAETFSGPLPLPPARHVAVVACMDARLHPARVLGLAEGDAHVIRNAGGVTDDVIRSLAISQRLLGTTEIVLIHHTDCGMLTFTDDQFAEQLQRDAGQRPGWTANAFSDLDDDVRESMRRIQQSPFVAEKGSVRGFVFDVATGRLNLWYSNIRFSAVACGSRMCQAVILYSLVIPPRMGFRQMRAADRSITSARERSGLSSGQRWAMPWCGRAAL